jgi:3'(2'), 5'-bisphosphate nucleotidase
MFEREITEVCRLVREAGRIVLGLYHTDFEVELKGKNDPVTEADKRANDFLVRGLRQAFPDDGIVAEESPQLGDSRQRVRCWYVDPLDGTKEFIAKNGEFSVMVGLAVEGRARFGVVYQPVGEKLYRGVVGEGAMLEQAGRTTELHVTSTADPAALRLVVSRSHRSSATDQLVQKLGITHERASGSVGLKVGLIAEQEADVYVHLSDKSSVWDSCGPEAVLRAAGGRFVDLSGRPFEYDNDELRNTRGILACNAAAYDAVQAAVREVAGEQGYAEKLGLSAK